MANKAWKQARKDIEALGVGFYVLPAACCYGCVQDSPVPKDKPALFHMKGRDFSANRGGLLAHANMTHELAAGVMFALSRAGIEFAWGGLGKRLAMSLPEVTA